MPEVKSSNMEIKTKKKTIPISIERDTTTSEKKVPNWKIHFYFLLLYAVRKRKKLRPENIVELQRNAHAKQIQLILRVKV